MCIILVKPKGVKFPSDRILNDCYWRNPDGAGVMLAAGGRLIIRKGLMTEDEFFDAYRNLQRKFYESPFVIHFRWSTGGGVQAGLCHPFPISNRRIVLLAKEPVNVKLAVAHNGVIPQWSGVGATVSDTLLYVKNEFFPAYKADPDIPFPNRPARKNRRRGQRVPIGLPGRYREDNGYRKLLKIQRGLLLETARRGGRFALTRSYTGSL